MSKTPASSMITPAAQTHHAAAHRGGSSNVPQGAIWQAAPVSISSG
ncbi:hypothetical protein [Ornithinimicrobium panacihumi]